MSQPSGNDRVSTAGLMRCCLDTLTDMYLTGPARVAAEGQTLQCKYAPDDPTHRMIFEHGVWRWHVEDVTHDELDESPPLDDGSWLE